VKTYEDFETEEEYEAYIAERSKLWESREPQRQVLQQMLSEHRTRVSELEKELLDKAIAFADEHGLAFELPWRGGHKLYLSPGALDLADVAVDADGDPLVEDGYCRYTEYGDELTGGWNYWEPSRNC
jgi:hypothetical protein